MGKKARSSAVSGIDGVVLSAAERRRAHLSQCLLGFFLMLASAAALGLLSGFGLVESGLAVPWAVYALGGELLVFWLIRSGVSERFDDPAMTLAQVLHAITCSAVAYVIVGEARGAVTSMLAVILMFGMFGLKRRQVILTALYAMLVFSLALLAVSGQSAAEGHLVLDVAYMVMVVVVLIGSANLTLRMQGLRDRLRNQRRELREALERIEVLAMRDELTGLPNRRHMLELMEMESRRCQRNRGNLSMAILDIDHFKLINDTYGHSAGDEALKLFAQIALGAIRGTDILARWGGEEFLLLLPDSAPDHVVTTCLRRVRQRVEAAVVPNGSVSFRMTVSIGVASYHYGEDVMQTLERADRAMYAAKAAGRNCVVVASRQLESGIIQTHVVPEPEAVYEGHAEAEERTSY